MYKVGVFPGKFFPPHRGHLNAIIQAATRCEKLYVVVSDNSNTTRRVCAESGINYMDLKLRARWLSIELQNFEHIKVLMLDESGIPEYPLGWEPWSKLLYRTVPEKFDVIFGGEPSYYEQHKENFPGIAYEIYDYDRSRYPISGTQIRENPYKYWEYILGSARPFFAKRVLITGTESCGKTTLVKYLAKIFYTSWAEETGRYYSERYMGMNEGVYTVEDFGKIAIEQFAEEEKALRSANKVVFFDTDALVTQYYCNMYLQERSSRVESFIDPSRYDLVILLQPNVKWVPDGLRFLGEDEKRWELHKLLKSMYIDHGFGDKMIEVSSSGYNDRLNEVISCVEMFLER